MYPKTAEGDVLPVLSSGSFYQAKYLISSYFPIKRKESNTWKHQLLLTDNINMFLSQFHKGLQRVDSIK